MSTSKHKTSSADDLRKAAFDHTKQYLELLAETLVADIAAHNGIRKFTKNPQLIGMLAEAIIRRFIERAVFPLRVSRGSIVYQNNCDPNSSKLPELDTIIWSPSILPSVFEVGDFALVPRQNAVGVLEIKSTNYRDAAQRIQSMILRTHDLLTWEGDPTARLAPWSRGVVCVRTKRSDPLLDKLISEDRAIALLRQEGDQIRVNHREVYRLSTFLLNVRIRARLTDSSQTVNYMAFWPDKVK